MIDKVDRQPMIEAIGLSKFYGPFAACRDVSFKVHEGELVAFLGPNGAGKSTTMKLLTGYVAPPKASRESPATTWPPTGSPVPSGSAICPKTDRCIPI